MKELENHACFGGMLHVFEHESSTLKCSMKFSIFLPPQAKTDKRPVLTFLSGLTCTHENFTTKAGAYAAAAREGLVIIAPDTSPRGDDIPNSPDYDLGQGAGFYVNATQAPWKDHFQMEDYITQELYTLIVSEFPIQKGQQAITGHSMGGHGALTLGLKYPDLYKSISAFAPIVAPSLVPWGQKAFTQYLGDDRAVWASHDACALMTASADRSKASEILIDQGLDDLFFSEQLQPELFVQVCDKVGQKIMLRQHARYDHSYYFIQTFIGDHIAHHARALGA